MAGFPAMWSVQERKGEGTPGAEPRRALLASVESLGFYLWGPKVPWKRFLGLLSE